MRLNLAVNCALSKLYLLHKGEWPTPFMHMVPFFDRIAPR